RRLSLAGLDGGGLSRASQQKRKSLGGEPHNTFELEQQQHCGWWAPRPAEFRSSVRSPLLGRRSHGITRLAASIIPPPLPGRASRSGARRAAPAAGVVAPPPPDPGLG